LFSPDVCCGRVHMHFAGHSPVTAVPVWSESRVDPVERRPQPVQPSAREISSRNDAENSQGSFYDYYS
jgi:hypothetical protein